VPEPKNAEQLALFEDRRMWRLLLARLHPDTGGDHDLFAFACTVRDEVSGGVRLAGNPEPNDGAHRTEGSAAPFLRAWQDAMDRWSSTNRDTLKNFWKV
jgi:hypothetical protein